MYQRVNEHDFIDAFRQFDRLDTGDGTGGNFTPAGCRVGMMKGKGKIVVDDPATTCRLIRKQFPDQADTLIKVTERPVLKALGNLSSAELKRIGANVEDTGDEIVIKPVDGDVDKLVNALLAEAEQWEEAA